MSLADYFARFGFCQHQIPTAPSPHLDLAVVIPCHDEPDLVPAMDALWACDRPAGDVEVIIVFNASELAEPAVRDRNRVLRDQASSWAEQHQDPRLLFHCLDFPRLPAKKAGVGLARKIGMDEALRRLHESGPPNRGVIACFDADCACAPNYLRAVSEHFQLAPECPGCSIYFEHPLAGPLSPVVYEAAALYELHLRYYVQGLRWANYPFAFHTVGSSMAVRADVYRAQGGMNTRQAGEDFHFLHKIIPLGAYSDLTQTTVYPSPRPSHRVPFGTGRAVRAYLEHGQMATYPFAAFEGVRALIDQCERWADGAAWDATAQRALPEPVTEFLQGENFEEALRLTRDHTAGRSSFRRRLLRWFDGFRIMKLIHHLRDAHGGERDVTGEARQLLDRLGLSQPVDGGAAPIGLLNAFRELDRASNFRSKFNVRC